MNLLPVMESLQQTRPIFHCEADFQFALAWELRRACPEAAIRLERPFPGAPGQRVDILLALDGAWYPIELKYPKKHLRAQVDGEPFLLPDGVHDLDMHDCVKDICRLEALVAQEKSVAAGFAVWLTNDSAYWRGDYDASYYKAFHAPHGAALSGALAYERPVATGLRGYDQPLVLRGRHAVAWHDYSDLGVPGGKFRYAVIEVKPEEREAMP